MSKYSEETRTGMEELRGAVGYLDNLREGFLDRFTVDQLLAIFRTAMAHDDWNEMADTWTDEQIAEALVTVEDYSQGLRDAFASGRKNHPEGGEFQ